MSMSSPTIVIWKDEELDVKLVSVLYIVILISAEHHSALQCAARLVNNVAAFSSI
jgi:hypothetical protein